MISLFNKLRSIFTTDDKPDPLKLVEEQLKIANGRIDLLEKKVVDYELILYDHHKTIASIASIQTNLLSELDRALKETAVKRSRSRSFTSSSKDDDFIN
jgi:uncharacterized membrane protein YgaE (UPF0421/DUF939 family)